MSIMFIDVGSNPTPATKIKVMTSIEYIFQQLEEQGLIYKNLNNELSISISASDYLDIKRLSKEMHKQEIIDTRENGIIEGIKRTNNINLYTEEQVRKLVEEANYDGQYLHAKSVTTQMMRDNAESYSEEIIQLLKQPKKD